MTSLVNNHFHPYFQDTLRLLSDQDQPYPPQPDSHQLACSHHSCCIADLPAVYR